MTLTGRTASLLLTDDGRHILATLSVEYPVDGLLVVEVRESEDLGLWIRIIRKGRSHIVLLRWEYVLTVDVPDRQEGSMFGLKGL